MIIKIRTIDVRGYPEFRLDGPPITESGDKIRLLNWTRDIYNRFSVAFKKHSATTARARNGESTAGMAFDTLVGKMVGVPKCITCDRLGLLQEACEKIIPLLPKDNPDVRNLVKILKIK